MQAEGAYGELPCTPAPAIACNRNVKSEMRCERLLQSPISDRVSVIAEGLRAIATDKGLAIPEQAANRAWAWAKSHEPDRVLMFARASVLRTGRLDCREINSMLQQQAEPPSSNLLPHASLSEKSTPGSVVAANDEVTAEIPITDAFGVERNSGMDCDD